MANFFPRWSNTILFQIIACLAVLGGGISLAVAYYFTPKYTRVGYEPDQPVPYDHKLHVGQLGMDCRYCHSFVETSGHANVPSAEVCWNCHKAVKLDSPKLEPLRRAIDPTFEGYDGKPVKWTRVHQAPDYVYFDHSVHINRGVSCVSCHGDVGEMKVVKHAESHSMSWCLDCHRDPAKHLRPLDEVFNLKWKPEDEEGKLAELGNPNSEKKAKKATQREIGKQLKHDWKINPPTNCSACHR